MSSQTGKGLPFPDPTDPDKPRVDIEALAKAIDQLIGSPPMTTAQRDVLTDLWPGRTIFNTTTNRLELNASGTAGDWAWVIDAKSPVPIANGGTGRSVAPSLLVNLASTAATSPLSAEPRPGVTGTLPVGNGGTGASTAADARNQLSVPSRDEVGDVDTNFVAAFESALTS